MSELVPRSYSNVPKLSRTNQIVLDASDHDYTVTGRYNNPNPISYYRNCQDVVFDLPRQPLADIVWNNIFYVDFKLTAQTRQPQILDLQRILVNPQHLRVLHLVVHDVPFDRAVRLINSLTWSQRLILDLHCVQPLEHMKIQFDQLRALDLKRFETVDYHYIFNNNEAVYIHMSGLQRLEFYNPRANRKGGDGAIRYSHIVRK